MKRLLGGSSELLWKGRIHIGDEPGVYGNATYSGLTTEFPVTLTPRTATPLEAPDITFDVVAEDANNFGPPYPGHHVTVAALTEVPGSKPPVWNKTIVGEAYLTGDLCYVETTVARQVRYLTVRVEADSTVTPGSYDDFVITELRMRSRTHSASLGFR